MYSCLPIVITGHIIFTNKLLCSPVEPSNDRFIVQQKQNDQFSDLFSRHFSFGFHSLSFFRPWLIKFLQERVTQIPSRELELLSCNSFEVRYWHVS